MKAVFLLLAIALPATYCFYLQPNLQTFPARAAGSPQVYKQLGDFFHQLHLASLKAGNQQTANPGKRCVNLFDNSCANGDINGAGSDDDWLNGGGDNPGRR